LYDHGEGIPKDKAKAVKYYQLAVAKGNARAQCNLGYMYRHGDGVSQDKQEARRLYQLAADQENAQAQYNLGCLYQEGDGVPKDVALAIKYYTMAAKQNHIGSHYNLGCNYETGEGTKQDYHQALTHFLFVTTSYEDVHKHLISIFDPKENLEGDRKEYHRVAIRYVAHGWPGTHSLVNPMCRKTLLELFFVLRSYEIRSEVAIPVELIFEVARHVVMKWNGPHYFGE